MSEVRIYKGSVLVDPECWVVDATGDVEAEARLIAAAPDLLAALEAVLEWIDTGMVDGVGFDDASVAQSLRAAIAKAKGD